MDAQDFVTNFAALFEDADPKTISLETPFRSIEGWSSLAALSIIAMVDELYSVQLRGNDIRNSSTIEDLFNLLKNRV
jgi:acyl carrier protein